MSKKIKLSRSTHYKYGNALFVRFHRRIYNRLKALKDLSVIYVTEAETEKYKKNIELLNDLTLESTAAAQTELLDGVNEKRNLRISFILNFILVMLDSPDVDAAEAARILELLTRPYRGIQKKANEAKTALILGLITDLRKAENAAYVTKLGLDAAITALEEANDEYDELQTARTSKRSKTLLNENTKTIRAEIMACYDNICDKIYAAQITCSDPEKLETIQTLLLEINQTCEEFKTSYNMSQGRKSGGNKNKKPDSDRPVIPDEDLDEDNGTGENDENKEPDEDIKDPDEGDGGGEDDRPVIPEEPDEETQEPGKDENGDDLPPIE